MTRKTTREDEGALAPPKKSTKTKAGHPLSAFSTEVRAPRQPSQAKLARQVLASYEMNGPRQLDMWVQQSLGLGYKPVYATSDSQKNWKKQGLWCIKVLLENLTNDEKDRAKAALRDYVSRRASGAGATSRAPSNPDVDQLNALLGPTPNSTPEDKLAAARAWAPRQGLSSIAHFKLNYESMPFEKRPFADEIRIANRRYYQALARSQHYAGKTISDLFPSRPEAVGGSLSQRHSFTPEEALEQLEQQRARGRERMRALRAARKRAARTADAN